MELSTRNDDYGKVGHHPLVIGGVNGSTHDICNDPVDDLDTPLGHEREGVFALIVTGRMVRKVSSSSANPESIGEVVDAKSILGILLLAAAQGAKVVVCCEGEDEEGAMTAVAGLIAARFEEER